MVTPPIGKPTEHTLHVDRQCHALADGAPVTLSPALCAAISRACSC
jgi:hypothetical protein